MGKIFITILLIAVIIFIGMSFWTAKTKASFIADYCSYTNPTSTSTMSGLSCKTKALASLTMRSFNCAKNIPKPACPIKPEAEKDPLCDLLEKNKHLTTSMEECRLTWECPEVVIDYNTVVAECEGKPAPKQ